MSKNPQVEEAKRWILEQRIYERHGNMLYVFPMLSSGDRIKRYAGGDER